MDNRCREHPASLPAKTPYYLLLFLIPLTKGIPEVVLSVAGLLILLILRWWRRFYALSPRRLRLQRGILLRHTTCIPLSRITTLTIERPLWLRIMGAAKVSVDTDAGTRWWADARLTVPNRHARLFLPESERGRVWRAAPWRLWLMAILSSDSFGGVLLLAAVFRQSSILLGEGIQEAVLNNLETAADMLALIPRTAALLILILVSGWLVGAIRHLLRHMPFTVYRGDATLTVYAGWLTRRIHCCALDAINYADRRQTLTACLLRKHMVYISCTGYGKDRNTLAVILPPCNGTYADRELAAMLPTLTAVAPTLRPCRGALWRYIRIPLFLLPVLPLCGQYVGILFPFWRELSHYLALIGTLPCLWLLAVRIIDRYRAGIGYADGKYTLCYARHLTLHQVTIPRHKIAAIQIRRTPWQRWKGTCDVTLYSYHEARHPHRVRHLSIQAVEKLFSTR